MSDTNTGADAAENEIDKLKSQVEEFKQLAEKHKNEYLYLRAEFDTHRRNVIKERAELVKFGSERLINEILGVIDNFERALETKVTAENLHSYSKGVEMTAQELKSTLAKFGVAEVACLGQAFDPSRHEAVGSEEAVGVPDGHITRVLRKAYLLHDKLLRPGQVIVAKAKS